ncbi:MULTISPECIES: FUSC family protein [unclassified Photobacterium]|uniref:FUSC family protein n=1 Tax=unclassified Photobacterium TaxID=2628852 RepID=UPI001EDD32C2|nr:MULTISPECIES: FUSC family protein [unclassified Photobacterium]MCG3864791.1 FUSC family protein [Photobacterium sp. Ph6]MCG3876213.1 FUSC family protein [Photobacterium sp. Ph5]
MRLQIFKALRLTLAILVSLYIAMLLGFKEAGWAITSVLIVSLGLIGEIRRKWWQRIAGHFWGCISGFFFIWTQGEQHYGVLIMLPFIVAVLSYLSFTQFLLKDFFKWGCVGFIIIVAASIDNPYIAFDVAIERFSCIVIGSTTAYLLFTLVPLDSEANIEQYYKSIIVLVSNLANIADEELLSTYVIFSLKQSAIKMLITVNYKSYIYEDKEYRMIANRLSSLEQIARHIYVLKYKKECTEKISEWINQCFDDIKINKKCRPYNSSNENVLVELLYKDLVKFQQGYTYDKLSQYRWRWQNRIFGVGADSPLFSAIIQFIGSFIALLLWQNGWPNGQSIFILTFVILLLCQYGERISPTIVLKGFILGTFYSFPLFILVFPYILTSGAFWIFIILLYLPLSYFYYGNYKSKFSNFTIFAAVIIVNTNSNNYIQSNGSFIDYINFFLSLIAVMLISCFLLSSLVIKNTDYRLNQQYSNWHNLAISLLTSSKPDIKNIAILERQLELIMSLYSKLDYTQKIKWKNKVSYIPLIMNKVRCERCYY